MTPLTITVTAALAVTACSHSSQASSATYQRRELEIPVRDGTRLFAVALIPRAPHGPLPIIL
ncbi:MAG: hypothetical protein ACREK8_03295, partial [Gemmatimonadales bacterium]